MAARRSSRLRSDGEGIPNVDSVKKTIAAYYGDPGTGIADKTSSPYIFELKGIESHSLRWLENQKPRAAKRGKKPAIVFDADDTTLWTYDMEDGAMRFNFYPALQDVWVQDQRFPATPGMVNLVNKVHRAGCTVVGITGRKRQPAGGHDREPDEARLRGIQRGELLHQVDRHGRLAGAVVLHLRGGEVHHDRVQVADPEALESQAGGGHRIIANFGDQFSDLNGGYADKAVKLPNPTYYLP